MAHAYRDFARTHPGRYAATLRVRGPDDPEADEASRWVLEVVFSVLARYGLAGADAVEAARALRAALHGFVALEAADGFGLPRDVDRSFNRLVEILDAALRTWNPRHGRDRRR